MNLRKIFDSNGLLLQHFLDYEHRPQQLVMAKAVSRAIEDNSCAVIEGATGVGKTFAYLVPLILSGKKAIISTSHKSLQDQLNDKDLPALSKILPIKFGWAVLKGKGNYLCHEHLKANQNELLSYLHNKKSLSSTEAQLKVKEIVEWAEITEEGDVDYYPGDLPFFVRDLITCKTNTVHNKDSVFYKLCFAVRARERAKESKIVLVNHTLLALDLALKQKTKGKAKLLPEVDVIIVDEAHTFEKYAMMAFSDEISEFSLRHLLNWRMVRKIMKPEKQQHLLKSFGNSLIKFLPPKNESGYYIQQEAETFNGFENIIEGIHNLAGRLESSKISRCNEEAVTKMKEIVKEAMNLTDRLEALGVKDEDMLRWSEARNNFLQRPIVKLKSVPLDISQLLKDGLYGNHTVIFTSATLAVNKSFEFFNYQLGIPESASGLIVDSPFDFKNNTLIYVSNGNQEKLREVEELLRCSRGNAFVLFTSYRDMNEFYRWVDVPYPKMVQVEGESRTQLLNRFKDTPHAVLFATKSFWEGVDVKGNSLIMVIIHKIPFENPRDLIYANKIERIDEKLGKDKHWSKYTIPDACLKLKQGVGRLIRSKTDIGVIALLDDRVNYRNYGRAIVNSLPPAHITQKLEDVRRFYKERKNGRK